jgi:hypothetical protein
VGWARSLARIKVSAFGAGDRGFKSHRARFLFVCWLLVGGFVYTVCLYVLFLVAVVWCGFGLELGPDPFWGLVP